MPLEGAAPTTPAYVFFEFAQWPVKVELRLDQPVTSSPRHVEAGAPYESAGGRAAAANPFNPGRARARSPHDHDEGDPDRRDDGDVRDHVRRRHRLTLTHRPQSGTLCMQMVPLWHLMGAQRSTLWGCGRLGVGVWGFGCGGAGERARGVET